MKKYEEEFENEFGNKIVVKVSEIDVQGKKGVSIFISGPTSDTENSITLVEAEVIYKQLGALIQSIKQVN